MDYISTRDTSEVPRSISSAQAIKTGIAPDGGLFMPTEIPHLAPGDIEKLCAMPYSERAAYILSMFLTDYDRDGLRADCAEAYSEERFPSSPAPVVSLGAGIYSLELWHGPTCAFKDMALQIMPRLLSRSLSMTQERKLAHILVATSGDTGKAALEGFCDVPGVKITVFYPCDGVSPMQKRQMITQKGDNVFVSAVRGNFDDAQTGVKKIFANPDYARRAEEEGFFFSSANSINWGRLAPQIVYYISAYCDLVKENEIFEGDVVNVCVPTGNFGNIFAAYLAREMGLPLGKLICASNSNCVLTDFIESGEYDRTREFYKTMSPSMDILVSSNLERLLYVIGGPSLASSCMNELSETGKYKVPYAVLEQIHEVFQGYFCSETETSEVIRSTFEDTGYLTDPHTAVGLGCAKKYIEESGDSRKVILASTANPYKFPADVLSCLGIECDSDKPEDIISTLEEASGEKAPAQLTRTLSMPVRFDGVVDSDDMISVIFGN